MANNETRILQNNTFEEWRQKDNEISFELGDVDQLDSRILDKTFTYTASADDSIFTGNDSTGKALRFEQKPDEVLDLLNIVIFTGLSSIPSNFIVGNTVTQSGGFSGKIVWINKNKVALSNTSGTFNAGQNLVQGSQNIPHANLARLISESVKVGLAKVKVQGTEITQGNVQAGYHIPNFVLKVNCTGSFSVPAEFTEGAILTQSGGFQGTLLSASTSTLRFKVVSGSFSVSQLVQLQGDSSKRILAANLGSLEVQDETFENIIELHTLAGASHSVHVISNSSVDAINEVQDDVGDITSLGTTDKSDLVTAVNELETGIRGSSSSLVSAGLTTSANDLLAAVNEHDAELGTITAGAMGTSASTVSTAIAELEQEIDVLNTRVEPTQAFDSRFSSSTVMDGLNELQTDIGTIGNLTTSATSLVTAVNELDLKQGSAALGTTATTLSGAVNELETAVRGSAGNYNLSTSANDLVAAINEHEGDLGSMSLDTSASNVTAAINELHGEINSNDTDIAARLIKVSGSSQELETDLTLGGNKTYTVESGSTLAIASGATLSIAGSSSNVSTFGTSFLEVDGNQTSTPMGLQISRDHISGAPTPYPAVQWREGSVSSKPERAWQIVGLNDAGTSSQEADIVTFFNAKDLVANNDESGISVAWDSSNQNFDFNVADPTLTFTSSTFRSSGNLGQATITNLGNTSFALTANKLDLGNNEKVLLGNSDELQIYHDGTNSYIEETGGELRIDTSLLRIRSQDGTENQATFDDDGAVALYHNNDSKFATTATGISVNGDVIASDYIQAEGIRVGSTGTDPGDGNLAVNNNATVAGNLTVTGNMTVNGTQTILNTDTLTVEDTLVLAGNNLSSEPNSGGFGLEVGPITNPSGVASGVTGAHSIVYNYATDQWEADGSLILSNATNTPPTIEGNNFGANKNLDFNAGAGITINTTTSGNDIDVEIINTLDGYSGWFLSTAGSDRGNIADDERVNFVGGTGLDVSYTSPSSVNTVTFDLANVSRTNTTASTNGTYVKGLTTNSQGQVTAVDSGDFDDIYSRSNTLVKLTGNQTIAGTKTFSSTISGSVSGNAGSATQLATSRNIIVDGDNHAFNGTANIDLSNAIKDMVGGMVSGNTESGITVSYDSTNRNLDFSVGTLNQNTTGNAATATKLANARTIGGVSFDGSANINLPGVNTGGNQNTSGNAATATTLQTARNIGGVSFNGSANINLPGVNTAGNQNTSGNAATATKLATARNIGGVSFDGSANINLPGVNTAGNQNTSGQAGSISGQANSATITASTTATANSIVRRNANGYVFGNYFNMTANDVSSGVTKIAVETSNDEYLRWGDAASIRSFLGVASGANNYTLPSAIANHTSANTASVVVSRDGSGGFSMGALSCSSVSSTGDVIAYSSDDRLKDRKGKIQNALDKVNSLTGFHYNWNDTAQELGFDKTDQVGLSAQDVEKVMPEVVKSAPINNDNGTDYKTLQYEKLVPLLVESIKELKAEIDELKKGKS